MIKTKIISVRDSDNKKYQLRNQLIDNFLQTNSLNHLYNFEISKAVTPSDWSLEDDFCLFEENKFKIHQRLGHTHGITNFLSHFRIWKLQEPTLVLEDDLIWDDSTFIQLYDIIVEFEKIPIKNKLLFLQSSCPWRPGFPDKEYSNLFNYDSFYVLPNNCPDVSGTAAYYLNTKDLIPTLTQQIGATDGVLHELLMRKELYYFIPKNWKNNLKLNINVQ